MTAFEYQDQLGHWVEVKARDWIVEGGALVFLANADDEQGSEIRVLGVGAGRWGKVRLKS